MYVQGRLMGCISHEDHIVVVLEAKSEPTEAEALTTTTIKIKLQRMGDHGNPKIMMLEKVAEASLVYELDCALLIVVAVGVAGT
jgi:hypothetical protein